MNRTIPRYLIKGLFLCLCVAAWSLSGCGILDVNNPNNVPVEDLDNPRAAPALANGALTEVAEAFSDAMLLSGTATDELIWIGSRDGWNEIDIGNVSNPQNEFTNGFFPDFGEARWTADNAIELIEGFEAAGGLEDQTDLIRAYLWGAIIYATIADTFEDFALSDQREAAPPIGPENMAEMAEL